MTALQLELVQAGRAAGEAAQRGWSVLAWFAIGLVAALLVIVVLVLRRNCRDLKQLKRGEAPGGEERAMDELIHSYTGTVASERGIRYRVQVYGAKNELGTWHGWLVFEPEGGGERLRTGRETTQPERDDLEYWASGLEPVYLEGALSRAAPA